METLVSLYISFFVPPRFSLVRVSLWCVVTHDGLIKGPVRDSLLCSSVIKRRISLQPNRPAVQALNTFHCFVSTHVVCAELA